MSSADDDRPCSHSCRRLGNATACFGRSSREHRIVVASRAENQRLDESWCEPAQSQVAVGRPHQRICFGKIGKALDLAAGLEEFRPSNGLVNDSEAIALAFLRNLKRRNGGIKQPHETPDILRASDVTLFLGIFSTREHPADQFVRHVEHGIGEAGFEIEQQGDLERTSPGVSSMC